MLEARPTRADKRSYYQRADVAEGYDDWRFGSPGGRYVDERELDAVCALLRGLPPGARVLDLPVGTGRVSARLLAAGHRCLGADASPAMLAQARARCGEELPLFQQDAFRLAIATGSLDAVVNLRFLFHFPELPPILRELSRVLRPGGYLVCDTLRWTPRALPLLQNRLGGRLWTIRDSQLRAAAAAHGLRVVEQRRLLLLPSLAYSLCPSPSLRPLDLAERLLPSRLRTKSLWLLQR